jgi:hypothetical protein
MMYITTYTILTYQTPQENLGKFGYKLDMEVFKKNFFKFGYLLTII